ncbi:hypothetical protein HDU91_003421 [Kappamyces sp. JEL0680]|nr:hypothetical protein HDU91_003421 [Kappamyces sp. JEL0680]
MTQVEIKIPPNMLPLVLGRGGEKLRGIEIGCNVTVEILDKKDNVDYRIAVVRGEEESCKEARSQIDDIVSGSGALSVLINPNVGDIRRKDEQTIYIQVPAARVGLIIGRGGETIRSLQDRTGSRINVDKGDDKGPSRTVVVIGTPPQIAMAQKEIEDIIQNNGYAGAFGIGGTTEQIKVSKDKVGLIIGRGGETIKLIQSDCNVKLNVEHYNDLEGDRVVTISGTADAIAMAKDMINEKTGLDDTGLIFDPQHAQVDAAYAAAYGSGAAARSNLAFDPIAYAGYYRSYYESLGYKFPPDFDVVAFVAQATISLNEQGVAPQYTE